jgi:CheY-like chemotaxis protein
VSEIGKAGERAAGLTRQLLAFSRKTVLQPRVLDLNGVITDSFKMLRRLVGEDVEVNKVLSPSLGRVKIDPGLFDQAIVNLAVNARDAMPQGGKLTFATATIELDPSYCLTNPTVTPGSYVMVAVSDNGTGMTEETKARIFEPFFTTKEPDKGTGLGLAMVYGFIKQSGGHIAVYSELNRGTTFKLYFPVVQEAVRARPSEPGLQLMPHGTETILLVEDEDGVRALARHVLKMCGYTVLEASDGGEALRVAERHQGQIHLLLTDVVMPGMSGRLVAERMAAFKPGIKIVFMSGYTEDAVVRHGVLEEETHFIQKPYSPAAVAQKVRAVLDG